jgi:hypothetical protein
VPDQSPVMALSLLSAESPFWRTTASTASMSPSQLTAESMSIHSYGNDASSQSFAALPWSKALWAPAPACRSIQANLLSNDWLHHYNKLKEA